MKTKDYFEDKEIEALEWAEMERTCPSRYFSLKKEYELARLEYEFNPTLSNLWKRDMLKTRVEFYENEGDDEYEPKTACQQDL
jgi:hypothetical protein